MNSSKVTISNLTLTKTAASRLLLFQSIGQLASYLISCLIAVIIVFFLAIQFFPEDFFDTQLVFLVVACVAISALIVVVGALNAEFSLLTVTQASDTLDYLDRQLDNLGYQGKIHESEDKTLYVTTGPEWSRWKENRVSVHHGTNQLIINGPIFTLWILQARLRRHISCG